MSFVKSKLKASRDAIQAKDWNRGAIEAAEALEHEPSNYNALVFRGLALLNLGQYEDSEKAYLAATKAQPDQMLAWQGLEKFYVERKQIEKYANVLRKLMDLALEVDDATKCAEAIQKLVTLQKEEGSRSDIASMLSLYLPSSRYYHLLSKLPRPDQSNPKATTTFEAEMSIHIRSLSILQEVISLLEEAEQIQIDREVEKRRTRLDSASKSREALRSEIGVEIWRTSKLPELYESILSHVDASDENRREAEHKLLVYQYTFLQALPNPSVRFSGPRSTAAKEDTGDKDRREKDEKQAALQRVLQLAGDIIAINVADELAWNITLEWNNVFSPAQLKSHLLRSYIDHFPRSGLSNSFKVLLQVIQDEQYLIEEKERHEKLDIDMASPDPLSLAITSMEESPESIIAHRIASSLYLVDRDWISCSDVASIGLELVKQNEIQYDIDLSLVKSGLESILATALTYLFPPQHHARALRLADSVLYQRKEDIDAKLCKAYMAQTSKRWNQARKLYVEVQDAAEKMTPSDYIHRRLSICPDPLREAQMEIAWCDVQLGHLEKGKEELELAIKEYDSSPVHNDKEEAKAWWRLGSCLWQMGGKDSHQAFTCFITALKKDSSYAPAFTSLGFYYKEVSFPSDLERASKCFQKAFELDAKENKAAFELAQSYASEDEWDLVYLVAQRVIEGEGGALALQGEIKSQKRHLTQNVWAWKAIGSAELLRNEYEKAIVAFQIASRTADTNDGHIWMRLGEAYTASGRLTAGLKTFTKAIEVFGGENEEVWQARFNIADIQRQQGLYQESLDTLMTIVYQEGKRKRVIGIVQTCAEVRLLLALDQVRQGYSTRAISNIYLAMVDAIEVIKGDRMMFAAWKVITDALFQCFEMSLEESEESKLLDIIDIVLLYSTCYNIDEGLPSVSSVDLSSIKEEATDNKMQFLTLSIYLNKLRTLLHHNDELMAGSVWMDLAVGLYRFSIVQDLQEDHLKAIETKNEAIACVKEALKMEPGNGQYWIALGTLVFTTSIKLAQHCYSKAIESEPLNVIPWTCLGLLYLRYDDLALAKECFTKAQTLDPDCVQVWIGKALLAKVSNQDHLCKKLFQHAFAVDEGKNIEAAYGFAASTTIPPSRLDLLSASFALFSYLIQRPLDVSALHLSALYSESLGNLNESMQRIQQASTLLEEDYEQKESIAKSQLFAICMNNLGRIELKKGKYEAAKGSFEMCLGLLMGKEEEEEERSQSNASLHLSKNDLNKAKIGSHCGNALTLYFMNQKQEAIEEIKRVLEEDDDDDEIENEEGRDELLILLVKMLWSVNERQEAEIIIKETLSSRPNSIKKLLLWGSICCLNQDEEELQLVEEEFQEIYIDKGDEMKEEVKEELKSFLISVRMQRQDYLGGLKLLRQYALNSPISQLNLAKVLLSLAVKDKTIDKGSEINTDYLEEALWHSLELMDKAMHDTRSQYDTLLIQSMLYCTHAYSLLEQMNKAQDMMTRCAYLQPGKESQLPLLHQIMSL